MGPLWEATRDLHHKAEGHPLAQRMVDGTVTAQEWCDWLHAHWLIHQAIDPHLPAHVRRTDALARDLLELLPHNPNWSPTADAFAASLRGDPAGIFGAAYLLVGAHRRGGQVIERAMRNKGVNLPANHIVFEDPAASELFVRDLRERVDLATGARNAFEVLFAVMGEIEARNNQAEGL
jgi:hypothetical protein